MSAGGREIVKIPSVNSEPGSGVSGHWPNLVSAFLVKHSLLHQERALLETVGGSGRFHSALHLNCSSVIKPQDTLLEAMCSCVVTPSTDEQAMQSERAMLAG